MNEKWGPAFFEIANANGETKFVSADEALNQPEVRARVLAVAQRELLEWHDRYWMFQELAPVCAAIVQVLKS